MDSSRGRPQNALPVRAGGHRASHHRAQLLFFHARDHLKRRIEPQPVDVPAQSQIAILGRVHAQIPCVVAAQAGRGSHFEIDQPERVESHDEAGDGIDGDHVDAHHGHPQCEVAAAVEAGAVAPRRGAMTAQPGAPTSGPALPPPSQDARGAATSKDRRPGEVVARAAEADEHRSVRATSEDRLRGEIVSLMKRGARRRREVETELERLKKDLESLFSFRLGEVHGINAMVQNLDMVTSVIQENIMQTRMQPMSIVMGKFPRLIRDLAKSLGKEIDLITIGQDVEVDKSIVELLSDPLTHLVRNSADHGIEAPEVREKCGKSRCGQIILRAFHEGGKVNVEISDDGAGIDPEKIRRHAISRGILTEKAAQAMSERELQAIIFMPGFSTAEQVSNVSGRGVGMDVVKTNIERMGGTIEIQSEPGSGTSMILRLPLTLAIIPSLIVSTEGRRFAIPQMSLEEIVRIRSGDVTRKIERIQGSEVLRLRGKLLPLVRLAEVLDLLRRQHGEREVVQLFCAQWERLAESVRAELADLPMEQRAQRLAALLTSLGYMAEVRAAEGAPPRLTEHNCAIRLVAERFPEVCAAEERFIADVLGTPVSRAAHIARGANCCEYCIQEGGMGTPLAVSATASHESSWQPAPDTVRGNER